MRRATEACLRWIDWSCVVIDESILTQVQRPVYTTRRLLRVSRWLATAAARLQRAAFCLQDTQMSLALAPEEGGGAPQLVCEAVQQWLVAALRLTVASEQLELLMAEVLRRAKEGVVDPRPVVAAPRPAAAHWFLRYCPAQPSDCILLLLQRRRRPAFPAPADAPRCVSRGRAPPSFRPARSSPLASRTTKGALYGY